MILLKDTVRQWGKKIKCRDESRDLRRVLESGIGSRNGQAHRFENNAPRVAWPSEKKIYRAVRASEMVGMHISGMPNDTRC